MKGLERRFGEREPLLVRRRQLNNACQEEDETLEDWADRVSKLIQESYSTGEEAILQDMAAGIFMKGCREKRAVLTAADKNPKTLSAALKAVKTAVGNQRAFLGKTYSARQVSWKDPETESPKPDSSEQLKRLVDQLESLSRWLDLHEKKTANSTATPKCDLCKDPGHISRNCPRKSPTVSPARAGTCFTCNEAGHYARDCPNKQPRTRSPSPRRPASQDPSPSKSPKA